jgi:hypothetical protein
VATKYRFVTNFPLDVQELVYGVHLVICGTDEIVNHIKEVKINIINYHSINLSSTAFWYYLMSGQRIFRTKSTTGRTER